MGTQGLYRPEIRIESSDEIGTIEWPTRPDLPPIKRPHLKVPRKRSNKVESVSSVDYSRPNSRLKKGHREHSWFKRKFCGCCILPELGRASASLLLRVANSTSHFRVSKRHHCQRQRVQQQIQLCRKSEFNLFVKLKMPSFCRITTSRLPNTPGGRFYRLIYSNSSSGWRISTSCAC